MGTDRPWLLKPPCNKIRRYPCQSEVQNFRPWRRDNAHKVTSESQLQPRDVVQSAFGDIRALRRVRHGGPYTPDLLELPSAVLMLSEAA